MGIFKDDKRQLQLERDGFATFDLLSKETTELLNGFFYQLHPVIENGFYVCIESSDRAYKEMIHSKIKSNIEQALNEYLQDYRALIYTMQVKGVGENGALGVHQDWSVTDESKHRSYSLWIPLIDTNIENGGMFLIKGSHRICTNTRGPSIKPPYSGHEDFLIRKMKHVPVKAGEALLFDQGLLHHTPPNRSSTPRVSIISTIIEKNARLQLYFHDGSPDSNHLEVHSAPDQFWFEYENYHKERFERPKFNLWNGLKINYQPKPFVQNDFSSELNKINGGPFKRLLAFAFGS